MDKGRNNVDFEQFAKLSNIGVMDSAPNFRDKMNKDKFRAVYLAQCLEAIKETELPI